MNIIHSLLAENKPLVIAHRGARTVAPENTLPAFTKAIELGADGIELDVQLSADGLPVIFHDSTLNRVTSSQGKIKDLTHKDLKALSVQGPEGTEAEIPTLNDVLEAIPTDRLINIELKDFRLNSALAETVCATIREHEAQNQIIFSSFNPFMLRAARKALPEIPVGYLYSQDLPLPLAKGWLAKPVIGPHEARNPHFGIVNEVYMAWALANNYMVNVWTVNETDDMKRMADLGVTSLITDEPDRALKLLSRKAS